MRLALIISILMISLTGCGKKGNPEPLTSFTEQR